jgi:site-specific DNA recombinase
MVHNPVYKGTHVYGDEIGATSDLAGLSTPAPALVPPDVWQAANEALTRNRRLSRTAEARDYLLRGLIFCGHCGSAYTGLTLPGYKDVADATDHQRGVLYRCNAKTYKGRTCTVSKSVPGSLETTIWEACRYWLERPEEVKAMLESAPVPSGNGAQGESSQAQRDRLQAGLASKQEERARVARAHRRGLYNDDTAETMLEEIGQEEALLRSELVRISQQEQMATEISRQIRESTEALLVLSQRLGETPSRADRRTIIEALVERITVTTTQAQADIVIRFRFSPSNCSRDTQPEGQINLIQQMVTEWNLPELQKKLLA